MDKKHDLRNRNRKKQNHKSTCQPQLRNINRNGTMYPESLEVALHSHVRQVGHHVCNDFETCTQTTQNCGSSTERGQRAQAKRRQLEENSLLWDTTVVETTQVQTALLYRNLLPI